MKPLMNRETRVVVLTSAISLTLAITGALLVGGDTDVDNVNTFMESISGKSSLYFGSLGVIAPMGFAFAAGVAAAFNPCGFAMLPAYMGVYVGANESNKLDSGLLGRLANAVLISSAVTVGFVALFGITGLLIGLGARSILPSVLPWLGLTIGLILTFMGACLLGGAGSVKFYNSFALRLAANIGDPRQMDIRGYFLFGISYGVASLGCTLPIFLSVVGSTFAISDIRASLGQFVLYGLGMGFVIMILTLGLTLIKSAFTGRFRKVVAQVQTIGIWMVIMSGTYIIFYWLTIGDLLL